MRAGLSVAFTMFVWNVRTGLPTVLVLLTFIQTQTNYIVRGETLTPPYFNLAEGKNITATATCGVDTEGPELYCKLIGANSDNDLNINVIQGQFCDVCDPSRPDKMHPPEFAVDGMETWWQSPPLSRGMKYNEVNLTIDLGQEFHVAYVYIKMANSPRPGLWVLEKSADYGKSYTPWQYFSDSPADCEERFGKESLQPIARDDSVICTSEYSKIVPLEGGEIPISLLNKRPSASHYFNSSILQEWTRATNVRLRFMRTKNLLGHLMSVARQDPTVTRRYFYSIKDISIGGRCMCNGHAQTCDIPDPQNHRVLLCNCKHNTCGAKCNSCCPGFEQKAWRQSKHNDPFRCEPCNCFLHTSDCIYDEEIDKKHLSLDIHGKYEGGGVCQNCQHNTEGINCNKCKSKFFRPTNKFWNETDVCQPCECDTFFSTGNCAEGTGKCECRKEFAPPNCDSCSFGYYDYPNCKPCECYLNGTQNLQCSLDDGVCACLPNFGGKYCKECAPGFYNFPECKRCECDVSGSVSNSCDQKSGNCSCKNNFSGKQCNECKDGYFQYPACDYCNCDNSGTKESICNKEDGKCICKEGYSGDRCEHCIAGYYGYPDCKPCNCSKIGSHSSNCGVSGKCSCLENFAGRTCNQCNPGYYSYPDCKSCDCDSYGSNGLSCDSEGKCECHKNYDGQHCNVCKEGYYNFPVCEECNCHPAGVVAGFAGCSSVPAGELCQCKERVQGRICNQCKSLFWNLSPNNPDGCEECKCNVAGVLGGISVCDIENGQCTCKPSVVARSCSECADGTYNLDENNLFGCTDCDCDVGGSVNGICNKATGQCICQTRVTGRTCKEPIQAHYFPTLYQYQYEVEDGRTIENNRVRYAHDERVFANYSWKGYAVFSTLQKEVIQVIHISKPSLYRMVFRFVNQNPYTVIGTIGITSDNPSDAEQYLRVQFRNTSQPEFVTVSGETGNTPSPLVMNPGWWTISIKVNQSVLLDYFVLLPEDFYLASILNQQIEKPCEINQLGLCRHYDYPNVAIFDTTKGPGGFIRKGQKTEQLSEFFLDNEHVSKLNITTRLPLLNSVQPDISFNVTVRKPGQYIIVINYITPLEEHQTNNINTTVHTKNGSEYGLSRLYSCPYTTMCRQVLTTIPGNVGIYNSIGNYITIDITGTNSNVAIHSITAIPLNEWSLDYIKPKPICIQKDGQCIKSTYRNPPETKKIQFEQVVGGELGKNRTQLYISNETSYLWLNESDNSVDLKGKVPVPGYYTFILQYYQPDFPEFDLDVIIQNGQFYEASVPVKHCPSQFGCRSVITQADNNNKFSLTENFMITVKKRSDDKHVYLDYLLIVHADLYNDRYLEEEDLDRTGEFITTCGQNHFNIDTKKEGFCRDSVFSITAGHNSGARACECDFAGSLSFECEKFGGQCHCKPNIIGRQCRACKTGYYGFPDCKPCNCPSTAYCEPLTGQCICPLHVTGERCDQCEPLTYGYDPIIGCEECKCNSLGVINNNYQCDLLNGSCQCKENVIGRTCDTCLPGHYLFPYCESCNCDTRGTLEQICDQVTAECYCKKNVNGPDCNFCREGTFNLQPDNEDGCSDCFCFGKTSRCSSSKLIKTSLNTMSDWNIVTLNTSTPTLSVTSSIKATNVELNSVAIYFSSTNKSETSYFAAPTDYLGKQLTSYGGELTYKIFYETETNGSAVSGPDVILQGADTYLSYSSFEQPPSSTEYTMKIQLVEGNFVMPTGVQARRDHIMEVLNNLQGIFLRGTYWTETVTSRITDVRLDIGVESDDKLQNRNASLALSVEECFCPPNYQGLSCEECAPGYYRVQTGPHGGYCIPCQCHGHATECDVNTGVCLNCTHHTRGDNCELCDIGYHGNALAGTSRDCLICACPLPITSNNFANACDVSTDGEKISCECKEGYFGARCQSCAAGYFGRPEITGDYCKPCQCSGNINPEDPSSCDTATGECLRCLNNTFGAACSLCAPGYFGDAVNLKDCQSCICDKLGTERCDSYTGKCVCKPNVIGDKCDRCEVQHYGFQSGRGCVPCDCAEASESDQCEDVTGQCKCKPGVSGRSCDRCSAGYWNYTEIGCFSCGCKSEYSLGFGCNALTGQCECLQGVIGDKCDQCPHRWAFVAEMGCHQCDTCTHALLDDTDHLNDLISPHINYFDSTQSGYFTRRRLDNMRESLEKLKPKFDEVDPYEINLSDLTDELKSLQQDSQNLHRKTNYTLDEIEQLRNLSSQYEEKGEILLEDFGQARREFYRVITDIDSISFELMNEDGPEVKTALDSAKNLLKDMQTHNFTGSEITATMELSKVNEVLKNVTDFEVPVNNLKNIITNIENNFKGFYDKLDDLNNHTLYSQNVAREANHIIEKSGKNRLKDKLENIESEINTAKNNLQESTDLVRNASKLLDISKNKLREVVDLPDSLDTRNLEFNSTLQNNINELAVVQKRKPAVEEHATNLSENAQKLDGLVTESRIESKDAVKAARAYQDIIEAVNNAKEAVNSAENDTNNAVNSLTGITDKSYEASQRASDSLNKAHQQYSDTEARLIPKHQVAVNKYKPVKAVHDKNEELLDDINKKLVNVQLKSFEDFYNSARKNADTASDHIYDIGSTANKTFTKLPNQTEQAKDLPKDWENMRRNITQTEKQVISISEKLPPIINKLESLPEKQEEMEKIASGIRSSINKLNEQIKLARDISNRIKIGVRFYPNTTLELRNPPNIENLTTSTKITGYFKTKNNDGLIWYLGNPVGTNLRRTKSDDYMALIVQNGYPVLLLDIGNGQDQIINNRFVADDTWYQFIVERVGHNAKLSIRGENPDRTEFINTAEKALEGPYTIFNLDKEKSKLFVGSFPINYEIQKGIDSNSFDGEIEDIVIGNEPISLWNFKNGYENNHGARERDKLVVLQPSTGFRFNGNGYAILDARKLPSVRARSSIKLSFKTFAPEGLLFLAGKGKSFLALEIRNGKVLYQYNLGGETKTWATGKAYNDGRWHTISADREGSKGHFSVDDVNAVDNRQTISGHVLDIGSSISVGGHPKKHDFPEVTQIKFDGCIDNVTLNGESIDLRDSYRYFDVTPGCPEKFAQMVSFGSRPGYVAWDRLSVNNDFKIVLKFKTNASDGLIFYATDIHQSAGISLAITKGHLKVISQKTELESKDKFNDGDWHVVSVVHNERMLRVDFDDFGYRVTDNQPPPLHMLYGHLYIGGVKIHPLPGTVGSSKPFVGCIADLTVNGNVKNFANTTDKSNEILDKCILDGISTEDVHADHEIPELPPPQKFPPVTTQSPEIITETEIWNVPPPRGDGGIDFKKTKPDESIQNKTIPPTEGPIGKPPPTTPKPIKEGCALPLVPAEEYGVRGVYYGTGKNSRSEYKIARGTYRKAFDFSLHFKTKRSEGIIFYVSDGQAHNNYIALTLSNGHVVFSYKSDKQIILKSNETYNDNKWHMVEFSKDSTSGKLVLDSVSTNTYSNFEKVGPLDVRKPFYIGGVKPEEQNFIFEYLNTTEPYDGCVSEFLMNGKPMEKPTEYSVVPCSENNEDGTFFSGAPQTFVKLRNKFNVGTLFNFELEIKPRVESGVLLAVYGKKDYLVLEMVDGAIKLSVENGKGAFTSTYQPSNKYYFCDGNWHSIHAVKSKNVVTLAVDKTFSDPKIGDRRSISTDTGSALILGGHRLINKLRGSQSRTPYVGCIRNIVLNNEHIEIVHSMVEGSVTIGYCRTD